MLVAADERQDGGDVRRRDALHRDDRRRQLAQRHERPGAVAVVPLVAHLQHLREDALHVERVVAGVDRAAHGRRQDRAEDVAHPGAAGSSTSSLKAPIRSTLPRPSLRLQNALPPWTGSSRHHIHIDGDGHAGHRADRAVVVAGVEGDLAVGQDPLGVLDVGRPALEQAGADQRAAHRAGRGLPGQRRPGVQQRAVREADHLAGRPDVDQLRARGEDPLDGHPVRRVAARVERERGEVGRVAEARRAPVDVVARTAPCARRASEKTSTPAATIAGGAESSPPRVIGTLPAGRGRTAWPRRWRRRRRRRPRRGRRPGGTSPAGRPRCR